MCKHCRRKYNEILLNEKFSLMKIVAVKGFVQVYAFTGWQKHRHYGKRNRKGKVVCHHCEWTGRVREHQLNGLLLPYSMKDLAISAVLEDYLAQMSRILGFSVLKTKDIQKIMRILVQKRKCVTIDFQRGNPRIMVSNLFDQVKARINHKVTRDKMCPIEPIVKRKKKSGLRNDLLSSTKRKRDHYDDMDEWERPKKRRKV